MPLLSGHSPDEDINPTPLLSNFWHLQEIPDRNHNLRLRRNLLLDSMYYAGLYGMFAYRKKLESPSTWTLRGRSEFSEVERDLQSHYQSPHPGPAHIHGMAFEGFDTAEGGNLRDIRTRSSVCILIPPCFLMLIMSTVSALPQSCASSHTKVYSSMT